MLCKKSVSIGEAALILGVSTSTMRRWDREGHFASSFRTTGNHRRYSLRDLQQFMGETQTDSTKISVGYARVSAADQKNDLVTQKQDLEKYLKSKCSNYEVISDCGSGLNFQKRGLKRLLSLIVSGKVETLVLTHQDRLVRFGFPLMQLLCQEFGVDIQLIHDQQNKDLNQQLAEDVITLVTVFSSRLYGLRSAEKRRLRKMAEAA